MADRIIEPRAATLGADAQKLRLAIADIDNLSQDAFSAITAVAKLALRALETPAGRNDLEALAGAFQVILCRAQEGEDAINSLAEEVGCNHIDKAERRRWAASMAPSLTAQGTGAR